MSVGSLKQVDLTHEVTDLSQVPYLNFGQEIQSKRNLMRYWAVITNLVDKKAKIESGAAMPLPQNSYVNILVDDPEMDFYSPKFITYPDSGEKVNRFGHDLEQVKLTIENTFVGIIKRIRSELSIEGEQNSISAARLSIGADDGAKIVLDPREPSKFITSCGVALKLFASETPDVLKTREVNGKSVIAYDIQLSYFR